MELLTMRVYPTLLYQPDPFFNFALPLPLLAQKLLSDV